MDSMDARPTIPMPVKGTCGCGCGESVPRRFRPGHDARLKSTLLDVARRGAPHQRERAAWSMIESGWSRFLDDEILWALPRRTRRGQRKLHIDEVERWIGEPTLYPGACHGRHHSRMDCPALTKAAKAAGETHPVSKLARPSWVRMLDADAERGDHLQTGWDLCEECTYTETVFEEVERGWFATAMLVTALEAESPKPAKPPTVAQRALADKPWTVEPDVDENGEPYPTPSWAEPTIAA